MTTQHPVHHRTARSPTGATGASAAQGTAATTLVPSPVETLWVGIDIGKRQHDAYLGCSGRGPRRRLRFRNHRKGLRQLEEAIEKSQAACQADDIVIGMEPSGAYWKALYEQLQTLGYRVVLVHAKAVKHNRETQGDNASKTDRKDAFCIWDLLRQGKYFTPVERDPEHAAAYRLMRHYEDSRKRSDEIRNQLRSSLALAFPELNERFQDLTGKTALSFLEKNPTPSQDQGPGTSALSTPLERTAWPDGPQVLRGSVRAGEEEYRRRRSDRAPGSGDPDPGGRVSPCPWGPSSVGSRWPRICSRLVRTISSCAASPGSAASSRSVCWPVSLKPADFRCGKQWVKLAGLDIRLLHKRRIDAQAAQDFSPRLRDSSESGSTSPRSTSSSIEGPFRDLYERRLQNSPGRGAKPRALMAVADKLVRVIFAMVRDQRPYDSRQDQRTAERYAAPRRAA